jgi:glycosyltransferase involved in cell wall biosynthesis
MDRHETVHSSQSCGGPAAVSLVSIVVPAYNEETGILEFNRRLTAVRTQLSAPSEVIFVDDGSTDSTLALLRTLKAADATIGILELSRNFGKEIALTAGLDRARGDVVVIIDADLQHPPELIPEFIARMSEGDIDIVYGLRASRAGETGIKRLTSRAFYRLINALSGRLVPIDAGDFRILNRRAADALLGVRERHRFMKGLFAWIGYRQVPFRYEPDLRG